jgi:hypothetical protein
LPRRRRSRVKRTQKTEYLLAASIALMTLLVYLPALQNDFVDWDDNVYISDNPHIRSLDMTFFKWAFWGFHAANWHPLTWVSHAVDYALWGLNPLGHHLTNSILHAANTFVVVLIAMRLLTAFKERTTQNGQLPFLHEQAILIAAGVTGLLFGIHPLHVESVAWVSERKDLLCALFYILSVMAYMKYIGSRQPAVGSRELEVSSQRSENRIPQATINNHQSAGFYLLALGYFVLALLSKPMAVSLPVVLLILDWHPFGRIRSLKTFLAACIEKLPFIALSLISSLLTILAQEAGNAMRTTDFTPLSMRMLVAAKALVAYLGKMIWPMKLVPFYPYPKDASLFTLEYLLPLILAAGITIACVLSVKKQKLWLSVWGYYVATLIPVLGIVQVGNQSMADRYTYLPSLGPFLIFGLVVAGAFRRIDVAARRGLIVRIISATVTLLVVVSLSYVTVKQTGVWKNSLDLWSYVIEQDAGVYQAYNMRGMIYANRGQFDRALDDLDKGLVVEPDAVKLLINHAFVCIKVGQTERGLSDLKRACDLGNDFSCKAAQSYAKGGH